jgi:hypothetical protein
VTARRETSSNTACLLVDLVPVPENALDGAPVLDQRAALVLGPCPSVCSFWLEAIEQLGRVSVIVRSNLSREGCS